MCNKPECKLPTFDAFDSQLITPHLLTAAEGRYLEGSRVRYSCKEEGYEFLPPPDGGEVEIVCGSDGSFNATELPECHPGWKLYKSFIC